MAAYVRILLDDEVLERTRSLIERHPLRTLDALHLASALQLQDQLGEPCAMISADSQLLAAAAAEHLPVRRIQL